MSDEEKVTLKWKCHLQKCGNSYCVILPKIILKKMDIQNASQAVFQITTDGETLVLRPK